jgi:hypothetical protein
MVKFLLQHASELEEKEDDIVMDGVSHEATSHDESLRLERSQVTQTMMRGIRNMEQRH